MAGPLNESEYLYGLHDPGGESIMLEKGIPGWVLVTEGIGFDANDQRGGNYRGLADRGLGVIVRLNAGYGGVGTIPPEARYADFAQRCANFARNSDGAHIWIIGNEMNHPIEWPGADWDWGANPPRPRRPDSAGEMITPERYVKCYRMTRDAIHKQPGHENDQVLTGAIAPWNNLTKYPGNENGDWVQYFQDVLNQLGPAGCDGMTLHAYTHGFDPSLLDSPAKMAAPFQNRHYHFRTYVDFMQAIPADMRRLPVYITETDQDDEWRNENNSWVRRAYGEIDYWNKNNDQQIRALVLYRWPRLDKWYIEGKSGVIDDFKMAMDWRLRWRSDGMAAPDATATYGALIQWKKAPAGGQAGGEMTAAVTVRNTGSMEWAASGGNPVRLGYHWYDGNGNQVGAADYRTSLPRNVKAGETVELATKVGLPSQAGAYTLSLDMVHENITWFADKGSQVLRTTVNVKPAPLPAEQFFAETKVWVRGVFLDFYRKYGLDICGYPITEPFMENGMAVQYFQRVAVEEFEKGKVRLRLTASQAFEASKQISALQQQVKSLGDRLKQFGGAAPRPDIQDISSQLPRDLPALVARPESQIKYVIIHHTAIAGAITVERIAQIYRQKGMAAMPGQFYIDSEGAIYQTNGLTEAVSNAPWALEGVNVIVAGNFSDVVPAPAQLDALAALCAWLLDAYGLEMTAVKGLSEGFTPTQSPGKQWLSGQNWKKMLVERIEPLRGSGGAAGPVDDAALATLRQQLEQALRDTEALREQATLARQERDRASAQATTLSARVASLQTEVSALQTALRQATKSAVPQPALRDVSKQLPRGDGNMIRRSEGDIRAIVIHHTGAPASVGADRVARAHTAHWPAIVCQYFIDGGGAILQTNAITEVVDKDQPWIFNGIGIHVAGNFNDAIPTDVQLSSLAALVAWLQQTYNVTDENVKGVREFVVTASPGNQWSEGQNWRKLLMARVQTVRESAPPAPGQAGNQALVQGLRQQVAQLQAQNQDLAQQLAAARAQLQGDRPDTAVTQALRQQIGQLQTQNQDLSRQLTAINAQMGQLQSQNQNLGRQLVATTTQVGQLQSQNQDLSKQLAAANAQLQGGVPLAGDLQAAKNQITALQNEKQALQNERDRLNKSVAGLQASIASLQKQIEAMQNGAIRPPAPAPAEPGAPQMVVKPAMQELVDKLAKNPNSSYNSRTLDKITHMAVHHSAAPANIPPERIAQYHVTNPTHQWPGIGYHYYIGPDGTIYHTQDLALSSYHVYKNNDYTVGVCVAGDFTDVVPTPAQLDAAARLIAWLMQELRIPLGNVWGHKEFPLNVTACPGKQWLEGGKWKNLLFEQIREAKGEAVAPAEKPIRHYLLFWERAEGWAQQDWVGAMNYIARFHPTAGFSLDDAKQAEYVTIVGGAGGVSPEVEAELRAAGVKVERLAGKDFAETKAMLDRLAQSGKPFLTF